MPHIVLAAVLLLLSNHYTRNLLLRWQSTLSIIDVSLILADDPESRFARGEKLPLEETDQFALELLPEMTSSIAEEFVEGKEAVIEEPNILRALMLVKGIGKKKASLFATYLESPSPKEEESTDEDFEKENEEP